MRPALLLPFALAGAMAAAGCGPGSDRAEQTAFQVPRRDLTLQQSQEPGSDVASPVELARTPVERRAAQRPSGAGRKPRSATRGPDSALDSAVASAAPMAQVKPADVPAAARESSEPPDPHALAPGQTVTIIPTSGGPSNGAPQPGPAPTDTDQRRGEDGPEPRAMPPARPGGRCAPGGRGHGEGARGGGFRGRAT